MNDLPVPNLPLLRKILDHIDAHPEEWNQGQWAQQIACGTACCIAGHAAVFSGGELIWHAEGEEDDDGRVWASNVRLPDGTTQHIETYAQKQLGLTDAEVDILNGLFTTSNTRDDIQRHAEAIAARAGERL